MSDGRFPYPVGIVAFNRPEHLAKACTQLLAQSVPVDPAQVFVRVDGFEGSLDHARGQQDRRADNRAILAQRMPEARLQEQSVNKGVAAAILDLEAWMFEDTDADWAVVLEEDIDQLDDHLEQLLWMIERFDAVPEVGMVTATGERAIEAWRGPDAVYPAVGSRAYAIRRGYFERKRPFFERYLEAIASRRYDQLDFADVAWSLANLGILSLAPNQDLVSFALLQRLDTLYLTTGRRHVRHIGVRGMHFQGSGPVDHALFATASHLEGPAAYSTPRFLTSPHATDESVVTEMESLRAESRAAFAREITHRLLLMQAHPEDYLRMTGLVRRIPRRLLLAMRRRTQMLLARIDVRLARFR